MAVVGEFGEARKQLDPNREPDTILFFGESFRIADDVGFMPLMEFVAAATSGIDSDSPAGLAAMRTWLSDCLADGEWPRFSACATRNKASADLLMEVSAKVYEVIAGRPTESPTGSPDGQSTTSPSSNTSASRKASLGLVPVEQAMGLAG